VGDADVARLRTRVSDTIGDVRRTVGSVSDTVSDAADSVRERARAAVARTDDYVHDSPWTAIGLAAALGVIVGVGAAAAAAARR